MEHELETITFNLFIFSLFSWIKDESLFTDSFVFIWLPYLEKLFSEYLGKLFLEYLEKLFLENLEKLFSEFLEKLFSEFYQYTHYSSVTSANETHLLNRSYIKYCQKVNLPKYYNLIQPHIVIN